MRTLTALLLVALLAGTTTLTACGGGAQTAKSGDTVQVNYTGTLDDGTAFDSTTNASFNHVAPLEFTIGSGKYLPKFEQAVINLSVNQSATVHIPFAEAYGPHEDNLSVTLNWSQFQNRSTPTVGEKIQVRNGNGYTLNGTVLNISDAGVTVDANFFLAGQNITFKITLVKIVSSK
jgi:peptidylprolyl isomerase